MWGTVLNLSRVGVRDTFFDLGGNSLLILQVLARLKEYGIQVPAVKLFQYPTIAAFAAYLEEEGSARKDKPAQEPVVRRGQSVRALRRPSRHHRYGRSLSGRS